MNSPAVAKDRRTIRVFNRADMDAKLTKAEAQLRHLARQDKDRGILITRHSPWEFTLELHHRVPFGTTLEIHAW